MKLEHLKNKCQQPGTVSFVLILSNFQNKQVRRKLGYFFVKKIEFHINLWGLNLFLIIFVTNKLLNEEVTKRVLCKVTFKLESCTFLLSSSLFFSYHFVCESYPIRI